jgi:hypothetical protein
MEPTNFYGDRAVSHSFTVLQKSDAEKANNRINKLAEIGRYLLRGGLKETDLQYHLEHHAIGKYPGTYQYNEHELKDDTALAVIKAKHELYSPSEKHFSDQIREWVMLQDGSFSLRDAYSQFQVVSGGQKNNIRTIMHRLVKEGLIEKSGKRSGEYVHLKCSATEEDWQSASEDKAPIWLPFDLDEISIINPGNIIVIAGSPNSGKTAFLMNCAYENQKMNYPDARYHKYNVHYFSSEIGPGSFKHRAAKFPYSTPEQWTTKFHTISGDFHTAVRPGPENLLIFDYIEIHDSFYLIGDILNKIHAKLDGAIAIVAIQKQPGREVGHGGTHTIEKPQLALALDSGAAKIVKLKEWAEGYENPNGKIYNFKLVDGCRYHKTMGWHYPSK